MMKKVLSLVMLFGMCAVLAVDKPRQVDIYRKEIRFEKSHVGDFILFSGVGLVVGMFTTMLFDDPAARYAVARAGGITVAGIGAGSLLGLLHYKYKKRWHQLRKDVPIVSLRPDGIWYEQKFMCKWEDIKFARRVGISPDVYRISLHGKWGFRLVTLDMERLDYSYHHLLNDLRSFGCSLRF